MSRPPLGLPTRFAFANQQRQSSGAGAAIYPALPHQSSAFVKIFAAFARQAAPSNQSQRCCPIDSSTL